MAKIEQALSRSTVSTMLDYAIEFAVGTVRHSVSKFGYVFAFTLPASAHNAESIILIASIDCGDLDDEHIAILREELMGDLEMSNAFFSASLCVAPYVRGESSYMALGGFAQFGGIFSKKIFLIKEDSTVERVDHAWFAYDPFESRKPLFQVLKRSEFSDDVNAVASEMFAKSKAIKMAEEMMRSSAPIVRKIESDNEEDLN